MQNLDFASCPNSALYSKRKISDYAVHFVSVSLLWNSSFIFIFKMFGCVWCWLQHVLIFVASCWVFCCRSGSLIVLRAPEREGSVAGVCRLSCSMAGGVLVPGPGIESVSPCIARQILNHWTTKDVPSLCVL